MTTLLMRMRAPMMSWGDHSRFGRFSPRVADGEAAMIAPTHHRRTHSH